MALYAFDLYSKVLYGPDVQVDNSVAPFVARQSGHGRISLTWNAPAHDTWNRMVLIRNGYGFASDVRDGTTVLDLAVGQSLNVFEDYNLTPGRFVYYTIFLATDLNPYDGAATYYPGDVVSYSGASWQCQKEGVLGVTPGSDVSIWQGVFVAEAWARAGDVATLVVGDHGYAEALYELTPRPYKVQVTDVTGPPDPLNGEYFAFMSIFGHHLDMIKEELDNLVGFYAPQTMSLSRLARLGEEFGVGGLVAATPQLQRLLIQNATATQRIKGTTTGIREIIRVLTGWNTDISVGPNLMLDSDQTSFVHPIYRPWDATVAYNLGQLVAYNGFIYQASAGPASIEAESLAGTATGTATISVENNHSTRSSWSSGAQLRIGASATGKNATVTFSVSATGSYDIALVPSIAPNYGMAQYAIDGVNIGTVFDGYVAGPHRAWWDFFSPPNTDAAPAPALHLGRLSLSAGSHTFTVTITGRNAASSGYNAGVDVLRLVPVAVSTLGNAPSGAASNNAYWNYVSAYPDTTTLINAYTGGVSSWEAQTYGGGVTASLGLDTALAARDASDHTHSYARVSNTHVSLAGDVGAHSVAKATSAAWNANVVYVKGNLVTRNGVLYQAVLPNIGNDPADAIKGPKYWTISTMSTTTLDPYLLASYGVPLTALPSWNPSTTFRAGTAVRFENLIYRAMATNTNIIPTGLPSDSATWEYLGPEQEAYTASAYTQAAAGSTGVPASTFIEFYDSNGVLQASAATPTNPTFYASFNDPIASLSGNQDNTLGKAWTTSGGAFTGRLGMIFRDPTVATSAGIRLATIADGRADACIGITFRTDTTNTTTVQAGIVFRYAGSNSFWMADRTGLRKNVAGTVTTLATWAQIPLGGRIYVRAQGSTITVFKHAGPNTANVQLASISDAFNSSATIHGIFERDTVVGP